MRSEHEMLDLILGTAQGDERIRAVVMNGSRTNPNAPRDIFQDFDIVYVVSEIESFTGDHSWIDRFGKRLMLQMPETMLDPPPMNNGMFIYLMQFDDGNRMDLVLIPLDKLPEFEPGSLSILLLDKDNLFPPFASSNDSDYLPKAPNEKAFADCCNEFWWVSTNVAKGLWREELSYAKTMLDLFVRDQLMKMLEWHVGVQTNFTRSPGKFGKYLKQTLAPELWHLFERTYADASYDATWDSLEAMCDLFRTTSKQLATHFGFVYPSEDDQNVTQYLKHVRELPKDASAIY